MIVLLTDMRKLVMVHMYNIGSEREGIIDGPSRLIVNKSGKRKGGIEGVDGLQM